MADIIFTKEAYREQLRLQIRLQREIVQYNTIKAVAKLLLKHTVIEDGFAYVQLLDEWVEAFKRGEMPK